MSVARCKLRDDAYLAPYWQTIHGRAEKARAMERRLTAGGSNLADFASAHEYYGLHREGAGWVFREWAPNASAITLVGDFSAWKKTPAHALTRINAKGDWELKLPAKAMRHAQLYRLLVEWPGGSGDRIPAYARRVVQDDKTKIFNAQVWEPEHGYQWKLPAFKRGFDVPFIYEAHVGMAQEREGVGSYAEFERNVLPRVVDAGYNTLQLMAVMEHPYYGSFGYHVSSFFAASSRFGAPEELKSLVDAAHAAGLAVIMDMVHSHAVLNEVEGLSRFDGTPYLYFHDGPRGEHVAWNSRCFDYGKPEVLHFLLSNCRYWLDDYHFDGFRFDGITSMLYHDHGLGTNYSSYDNYFNAGVDEDAVVYLTLANRLIHQIRPDAMSVAEDVSGMPGLGAPVEDDGIGFDFRMAMGVPDYWFHLVKKVSDEKWNTDSTWHELTNRRGEERTISYVECHDQAIVGDKTLIFWLADAHMYWNMDAHKDNLEVSRAIALHKMIRLATAAAADSGYLNFMGNEFGHPEWIDFPREGNGWSYKFARRLWSLRDDPQLKFHFLADFDREMLRAVRGGGLLDKESPRLVHSHCDDQILAFERGGLLFLFNFSPTRSVSDYMISAAPGEYQLVMDSDETRFGGYGRIAAEQHFCTSQSNGRLGIKVYLPCRVAMVLKRV